MLLKSVVAKMQKFKNLFLTSNGELYAKKIDGGKLSFLSRSFARSSFLLLSVFEGKVSTLFDKDSLSCTSKYAHAQQLFTTPKYLFSSFSIAQQ